MTQSTHTDLTARDTIMKLLSNDEVAKVSNAEDQASLADGSHFVDLHHLGRGVQIARASNPADIGHIITRSSVTVDTWGEIVAEVAKLAIARGPHSAGSQLEIADGAQPAPAAH